MKYWNVLIVGVLLFVACNDQPNNTKKSKAESQTLRISVDESFQPVISEEIKVFKSDFPDVKLIVEYKPEAECLRDLEKDSTKIVIISRELTRDETKFYNGKIGYKPEFAQLAKDA